MVCCEWLRGSLQLLVLLLGATDVWAQVSSGRSAGRRTYCSTEGFSVTCNLDEVLLIQRATYGRMYVNSCVTRNYGYIGCSANVTSVLAGLCSGRQECNIINMEAEFTQYNNCPRDLHSFLEASHICVKVAIAGSQHCGSDGTLQVTDTEGYLSSVVAERSGVGSSGCPWIITTQPGLRINITLLDFTNRPTARPARHREGFLLEPQYCRQYGYIRDGREVHNAVRCTGDNSTEQHIYLSKTNSVEVVMYHQKGAEESVTRFMFKYEVVGCLLPILPKNMYIEGKGNDITVHCNHTDEKWYLTCVDGSWEGTLFNCSQGSSGHTGIASGGKLLPIGITIFLVLGVALLICILILALGFLHLRRTQESPAVSKEESPLYGTIGNDKHDRSPRFATLDRANMHSRSPVTPRMYPEGNYAHIWEIRRPPLPLISVPAPCADVLQDPEPERQEPEDFSRTDPKRTSFTTFRPHGEHIYETPKFGRKQPKTPGVVPVTVRRTSEPPSPFYYELDPKTGLPEGAAISRPMSDMPCNAPAISDAEIQDSK